MSGVNLNVAAGILADILVEQPKLGEILLETMEVQRRIDPLAGHGTMHGVLAFINLELSDSQIDKLMSLVVNEYELYVFLRSVEFGAFDRKKIGEILDNDGIPVLQFDLLISIIAEQYTEFKRDLALQFCR